MIHLLAFWNYRISASLTLLTGVLLLWQFPGAKGTAGHIARWAVALFLSVFVVLHEHADRSKSAGGAHYESMAHPVAGFPSECGLDLLRFDGADACSRRIFDAGAKAPTAGLNRAARRAQICWLRGGKCWLASNIASEIGSRIPRV